MSGTTSQTVGTLLEFALRAAGILGDGMPLAAEDANTALTALNMMLAAWNAKRWDVYGLLDVFVPATGATSYTIGAGGDFNTPRPDRIEAAYMRQNPSDSGLPVDYHLEVLPSYEDYARISVKSVESFARYAFYDSAYPLGRLYFWPIPNQSVFDLHVLVKQPLGQFSSMTATMTLPPPYQEAVVYNLAVRIRALYGMQPDPTIGALAQASLSTIQNSNAQVPTLRLPQALRGASGTGWYNVWSDNN